MAGNLEDYLDEIMNDHFDGQDGSVGTGAPDSFAARFQGASPEEMLRQKFIEDLLARHDAPVVYEDLPPEQRNVGRPTAHRV